DLPVRVLLLEHGLRRRDVLRALRHYVGDLAPPGQVVRLRPRVDPRERRRPMALTAAAGQRTSRSTRLVPRRTRLALSCALLFLIALICIGPFLMMLLAALTPNQFYLVFPPVTDPRRMGFGNFETLFSSSLMPRWILNSFVVSGAITFLQPFTSALAAYVFARKSLPERNLLFWSLIIPLT